MVFFLMTPRALFKSLNRTGPHLPLKVLFEINLAGAGSLSNNNLKSPLLSAGLPMGRVTSCIIKFVAVLSFQHASHSLSMSHDQTFPSASVWGCRLKKRGLLKAGG